jgi:uncharacterized protein YbjT (DUF2867 family)
MPCVGGRRRFALAISCAGRISPRRRRRQTSATSPRSPFRALCEDGHGRAEYVLTGPQSLSQFEQISTIGRALGRALRIEEISPDAARRELLTIGPLAAVNMLLTAWAAAVGQPAHVTSTVAEITGAPAHTFHDWASDNAAEFRA